MFLIFGLNQNSPIVEIIHPLTLTSSLPSLPLYPLFLSTKFNDHCCAIIILCSIILRCIYSTLYLFNKSVAKYKAGITKYMLVSL